MARLSVVVGSSVVALSCLAFGDKLLIADAHAEDRATVVHDATEEASEAVDDAHAATEEAIEESEENAEEVMDDAEEAVDEASAEADQADSKIKGDVERTRQNLGEITNVPVGRIDLGKVKDSATGVLGRPKSE
ncbi:MAG: hypothetical protein KDD69_02620 [Bdellovibrionales bacterium]|nr:hypothetical protein [Bdellovibrionales bacterium]